MLLMNLDESLKSSTAGYRGDCERAGQVKISNKELETEEDDHVNKIICKMISLF